MYCTVTSQMRFLRAPRHRYYHVITTADKYLVFGDGMVTRRHRARHPRRATLETIVLDRDRDSAPRAIETTTNPFLPSSSSSPPSSRVAHSFSFSRRRLNASPLPRAPSPCRRVRTPFSRRPRTRPRRRDRSLDDATRARGRSDARAPRRGRPRGVDDDFDAIGTRLPHRDD